MALPACLATTKHVELLIKPQDEIFEIIEHAITIAALRWPEQLQADQDRLLHGFKMSRLSAAQETTTTKELNSAGGDCVREKKEEAVEKPPRRIIHVKVDLPDRDRKSASVSAKPALQKADSARPAIQPCPTGATLTAAKRKSAKSKCDDGEAKGDYESRLEVTKRKLQRGYTACDESRKRSKVINFWTEVPKNTQQQVLCDKNVSSASSTGNKKTTSTTPSSSQQQFGRRCQRVPPQIQRSRPPLRC